MRIIHREKISLGVIRYLRTVYPKNDIVHKEKCSTIYLIRTKIYGSNVKSVKDELYENKTKLNEYDK